MLSIYPPNPLFRPSGLQIRVRWVYNFFVSTPIRTRPVDEYITSGSPEIAVGEVNWTVRIKISFPAFKSRNYRLYFIGQFISLIGTWLQIVAEGWLVYSLTRSAFWVGLDAAAATIPTLFLSLIGGVIVDRYPKKYILLFTQISAMILAFILGVLTVTGAIIVWEILLLSFLLGIVNAVDAPARQSYIIELIDSKNSLSSAIALNAGMFNAARVLGPGFGGFLIAVVGVGVAFLLNAASYLAVIAALWYISTPMSVSVTKGNPIKEIADGIRYAWNHETVRLLLMLTAVASILGWSYATLLPVVAKEIFSLNASGLGFLYAAGGLGALLGTFAVSAYAKKIHPTVYIFGGNIIFSLGLLVFTFISHIPFALILLGIVGFGLISQFAMTNAVIQHNVENTMRGRIMSLYTLVFIGVSPIGNFEIGFVAEHIGSEFAIRLGALVMLVFGLVVFRCRKSIHWNA